MSNTKQKHKSMTHKQWADATRPSQPCSVHHITFGGVCLNCGYEPEEQQTGRDWEREQNDKL